MPLYIVKKGEENTPLLEYLQGNIPVAPRSYLRQLISSGKVSCNSSPATPDCLVHEGDSIALPESGRILRLIDESNKLPLVLYESPSILVVHKPSGLATHSGKGHEEDNLTVRVKMMLLLRDEKFMTAPVHRLDRFTSGPVIFGKGKKAISALGCMLQGQTIEKRYLALVAAGLPKKGLLSGHLRSKGKKKHAETGYEALETQGNFTLLELRLMTGRQHQIRKQLSDAGYPIAGDERYRGLKTPDLKRLFLHCHKLLFTDPFTNQPVCIMVSLPEDLAYCLLANGFNYTHKSAGSSHTG